MKTITTIALAIACIPLAVSAVKAQGCVADAAFADYLVSVNVSRWF